MVAPLTADAWLTMPPWPWEYQGPTANRRVPARPRGPARRATAAGAIARANRQPACGCYLARAQTEIARAYALFVLTLEGDRISAITWFTDTSVSPHFGLPRMLR
jgi:RNA polymerase sigma-70 factor, ECF subfamily